MFYDEDHTLGNSLRNILSQRADVEFCGYSIPHPSENKLNLRLQTIGFLMIFHCFFSFFFSFFFHLCLLKTETQMM